MARIIIVDDEDGARLTLGDILKLEGYEIHTAASGEEALRVLRAQAFDVMILDLKMRGMGGMEVLEEIAARGLAVQVIVLTAYGTLDTARQAIRYQVHDYLLKPVSPDQIIESVRRALAKRATPGIAEASAGYTVDPDRVTHLPGGATLAWDTRQIIWAGGKLSLTPTEGRLLRLLFEHRNEMVSHSECVWKIQGYRVDNEEAAKILRPVVSRMRQKLAIVPEWNDRIKNVRGAGYVLEWDPQPGLPRSAVGTDR